MATKATHSATIWSAQPSVEKPSATASPSAVPFPPNPDRTIAEELLEPTRIYADLLDPMGDHGVLIVGAREHAAFDEFIDGLQPTRLGRAVTTHFLDPDQAFLILDGIRKDKHPYQIVADVELMEKLAGSEDEEEIDNIKKGEPLMINVGSEAWRPAVTGFF